MTEQKQSWPLRLWNSLSATGLLVATLFFALSLTPSLLPRHFAVQGLLSGVSLAVGYACGVFGHWLYHFLELRDPGEKASHWIKMTSLVVFAGTAAVMLFMSSTWQNNIWELWGMPPNHRIAQLWLGIIALVIFLILFAIGRLFARTYRMVARRLQPIIPRKILGVLSIAGTLVLFALVVDGLIFRVGLSVADDAWQVMDELIEPEIPRPTEPGRAGSSASLLKWEELSRTGRDFIALGPRQADLEEFLGEPAKEPIRVYVGLRSAETDEERAQLALDELIRTGAFERSVLLLITPTGTGWIDPGGINTFEYLHRGDVASVVQQYSYLPSTVSIFVEPNYSAASARLLFRTVYDYWKTLPEGDRPRFYLYGLSLGAQGSQQAVNALDIIDDPIDGALWAGPPFPSQPWGNLKNGRKPGSPAWLPVIEDGSIIRFTNQENQIASAEAPWRRIRIGYLQYASDPLVFFEPTSFYREPEWMKPPRGPDVTPDLVWFPVVTFFQIASDIMTSSLNIGHGHSYAQEHYIDAWLEVTEPPDWTDGEVQRLKARFIEGRPTGYFDRRAQQD